MGVVVARFRVGNSIDVLRIWRRLWRLGLGTRARLGVSRREDQLGRFCAVVGLRSMTFGLWKTITASSAKCVPTDTPTARWRWNRELVGERPVNTAPTSLPD